MCGQFCNNMNDHSWSHGHQYELAVSLHGTFGELTPATLDSIAHVLHSILGNKLRTSTLIDVGSGRGKLAICMANRVSFRAVLGIEMDGQLHSFAQQNSMGTQNIFVKGDLNDLTSLRGANIVLGLHGSRASEVHAWMYGCMGMHGRIYVYLYVYLQGLTVLLARP